MRGEAALRRAAERLLARKAELLEAWIRAIAEVVKLHESEIRPFAARNLEALLGRLGRGELDAFLQDEELAAFEAARTGIAAHPLAAAIRTFAAASLPFVDSETASAELAEISGALHELACRRFEVLLRAQEEESARRLVEAQEQAARAAERARELAQANEELRRSETRSQRRADQIALLASVIQRVAGVLDPERLMQEAANAIQARMGYTYVAVVVLDDEAVLVGRWAGRRGLSRRSAGRAQGPARGLIGRALRKRAPQVVADVAADPDYLPDVAGTRSEMVVPLIDEGEPIGAIDFQSEKPGAFDLDDVVAGETIADFLVVALRNARLVASLRGGGG